ncbi:MAG: hypothetical protein QXQ41_05275 [Candidatus Bathyarchaeia archaeon]
MSYPEGKTSKHATVRIPKDLLTAIEKFLETKEAKEMGYLYITDIVTEAVREFLKSKGYYPLPRFEFINHDENGVKILDRQLKRVADVFIKPKGTWCDLCKETMCVHVMFALSSDELQNYLKEKRKEGWRIPEL